MVGALDGLYFWRSLRQPLHQHRFCALPYPELHAVALTEHLGGIADALQRNIVVAPRVAQLELAETILETLIGGLIAHVACVPFLFEITEVICELHFIYASVVISGKLQVRKNSFAHCWQVSTHIQLFHIAYDGLPTVIDVDMLDADILLRPMTEAPEVSTCVA